MIIAPNPKKSSVIFFLMLVAIIGAGIFLRTTKFTSEGYNHDAMWILAEGLAFFYDYPGDPTAVHAEPPLGNIVCASSCLLSDEDFSGIERVSPYFYPALWEFLSRPMYNAIDECHYFGRILGILGLFLFSILCISLLKNFWAILPIITYSLSPYLVYWTRVIHTELVQWPLTWLGLLLTFKGYSEDNIKKERRFFSIALFLFALATSAKLNGGIFIIFAFVLYIEKNKKNIIENFRRIAENKEFVILRGTLRVIKNAILFGIFTYLGLTLVYKFNIFGFFKTVGYYSRGWPQFAGFSFNPMRIVRNIYMLFLNIFSPMEALLIPFIVWYLALQIRALVKKEEIPPLQKFMNALFLLYVVGAFQYMTGDVHVFRTVILYLPFFLSVPLTLKYFFSRFKIKKFVKYIVVVLFILSYTAINLANYIPYSTAYENPVVKPFFNIAKIGYHGSVGDDMSRYNDLGFKEIIEYDQIRPDVIKLNLSENESIIAPRQIIERKDEEYGMYIISQKFKSEYGRKLTLKEKILNNINPKGRKYKYAIVESPAELEGINKTLIKEYGYGGKVYYYLYKLES